MSDRFSPQPVNHGVAVQAGQFCDIVYQAIESAGFEWTVGWNRYDLSRGLVP